MRCAAAGVRSINLDLVYGLPRQTTPGLLELSIKFSTSSPTGWRCSAMPMCPG